MLELIPDHLRLFVVIGGLLLVLLLLGSLSQKYEQYVAAKRLAVKRIMVGTHQIEAALEKTQVAGLPPGMAKLLRKELLARYITVRQIFPNQPELNRLIAQAEERSRSEADGSDAVNGAALTSLTQLNRYIIGLNDVLALYRGNLLGRAVSTADRKAAQLKLVEFQLMAAQRFYTREATEAAKKGEWSSAIRSARALESFLFSKPKVSQLSGQYRDEAKVLVRALSDHHLPGQAAQPGIEEQSA